MIVGDSICGHSQPNLSFLDVFYFAARGGAGEVEREGGGGRKGKEEGRARKRRKENIGRVFHPCLPHSSTQPFLQNRLTPGDQHSGVAAR